MKTGIRYFPVATLRGRIVTITLLLVATNAAAWIWALVAFRNLPVLIGTSLLAYGFGLRHAFDADHIAAIDNVTRKLMQEGKRPVAVGFFFSLGHSTIVVLASAAVAMAAIGFEGQFAALKAIGSLVGTSVSVLFLLLIAIMNVVVLWNTWKTFRQVKDGGMCEEEDLNALLAGRGLLNRIFRPMFRMIRHSWHMYPLGFLFGLGFDTATEVGVLGISAAAAGHGVHIWSIMIFPALFTAGMSLVDTTDGLLMLGAYGWAFINPLRKLYYNMTITSLSVIVAIVIGGIEALGLIADHYHLGGGFWYLIARLNDHFGEIGLLIVGLFALGWLIATASYRWSKFQRPASTLPEEGLIELDN